MARLEDHPVPQRLFHGVNLISFAALAVSGYYIYRPFAPGLMGAMKTIHYFFMFVISANLVARVYYAFFGRYRDAGVFAFRGADLKTLGPMVGYYLTLRPRPRTDRLNPLQKIAYLAAVGMLVLQAVTGFSLYWPNSVLGAVVRAVGGLHNLRLIHIALMWIFFAGILIHLYLVLTEAYDDFLLMFFGRLRPPAAAGRRIRPGA